MPEQTTWYPHHGCSHASAHALIVAVVLAAACIWPTRAGANDQCETLLAEDPPLADAQMLINQYTFGLNSLDFCIQAYETKRKPQAVIAHYRGLWQERGGELHTSKSSNGAPMLMLSEKAHNRSVTAIADAGGSAVQLSIMLQPREGEQPVIAPDLAISGFEPTHDAKDEFGRQVILQTSLDPVTALAQLENWFVGQGWEPAAEDTVISPVLPPQAAAVRLESMQQFLTIHADDGTAMLFFSQKQPWAE